jgi:uncharacterized protein (DUF58 family)
MEASLAWRPWLRRWVFKGVSAGRSAVSLRYCRLYILPTRNGLMFALMLFAMWLGAINYNNSMIYLLTFLLSSIAIVSILHTFRNLIGLRVTPLEAEPVFAGETAQFPLLIENPSRRGRTGVGLQYRQKLQSLADIPSRGNGQLTLQLHAPRRGRLQADRCALITIFPTGLFRAWSWLDLELSCLVIPAPEQGQVPGPAARSDQQPGAERGRGGEDFRGLRSYQPGDPLRHLSWRALARGQELQTKEFGGSGLSEVWLDWDDTCGLDVEARLSRLCRWVLDADAAGQVFGLRLPGVVIEPAAGASHRRRCLEALAQHGL